MLILLEFITAFVVFFAVLFLGFQLTEVKEMPSWLDYKPFNCRKCLTFWSLIVIYLTVGISFQMWWFLGLGCLLAIGNAIAMHIDEREKTISIDDIEIKGFTQ